MRLRTALKIVAAIGTPREGAHSDGKLGAALRRVERTRSAKADAAFWNALMRYLGPSGRAEILARQGCPDMAFDLLMRTPEEEWAGDSTALAKEMIRG